MPWTVTISRPDALPLGVVQVVQDAVHRGIPGVQFYRESSGIEKMAKMNVPLPDVLRHHFEKSPASIQGDYQEGELFLRLYLGSEAEVRSIDVEIRGNGNPLPAIAAICLPNSWAACEPSGKAIDLRTTEAAGWERFREYRDAGVHSFQKSEENQRD